LGTNDAGWVAGRDAGAAKGGVVVNWLSAVREQ
jgi:hypothetical protein